MATKFEIEKFNGNIFSLLKLKMKVILTKDKCLAAIGEMPAEANQFKIGGGFGGDERESMELGFNGSHNHGNVASTSEDGNAMCCKVVVANKSRKRFADVWLFDTGATFHMTAKRELFHQYKQISGGGSVYICNDHELKIIRIGSIMVKMHDGTVHTIRDVRHVKALKKHLLSLRSLDDLGCKIAIIEEAEASVASHIPSHRVVVTWHHKLGHMSEQGMKILVERKLLHGLTKISLPFYEHCVIIKNRFYPWEEQSTLYPLLMTILGDVSKDVVFVEDKIQENKEGNNTTKETTSIQLEKEVQSNDSFKVAPKHEMNETNESQAPATRTLNHERKRPGWHSDYVMESNVAYCLLIEKGEPSTLQEALNNPDASFWKATMQEKKSKLFIRTKRGN
nr:Gag-Pol polyprotein [Tanacetum cinerariifolium]